MLLTAILIGLVCTLVLSLLMLVVYLVLENVFDSLDQQPKPRKPFSQ